MAFTKKTQTKITENYLALIDHEALRKLLEVPKGVSGFRVWVEVPCWVGGGEDLDIDAACPIHVQYDVVSVTDDPAPA